MSIAIAMTTYNAGDRVLTQLQSIVNQTVPPNEIVICDDCSKDNTVDLVNSFRHLYPDIKWKIVINETNLGYKKNFAKAILETESEIIFLADQDDCWYKRKIEKMYRAMKKYPEIKLLACQYNTYNETAFLREKHLENDLDIDEKNISDYFEAHIHRLDFKKHFYMTHFPGCCFAIRDVCKEWFVKPYWNGDEPHDEYLLIMAQLKDCAFYVDEQLIFYLRHTDAVTFYKMKDRKQREEHLVGKRKALEMSLLVVNRESINNKDYKKKMIGEEIQFCNQRVAFLRKPSLFKALGLLLNMKKYERISYLWADLYFSMKKREIG